jgi:hypothetical protein
MFFRWHSKSWSLGGRREWKLRCVKVMLNTLQIKSAMNASRPAFYMKNHLFEAFVSMIESLPANGIMLVAELQGQMIEDDLSQRRALPMEDAVSVLNFCRFLQAMAQGSGIFPTVLPRHHLAAYRKIVNRLMEAGELSLNAGEQFNQTFLSVFSDNHWLFEFNHRGVERQVERTQRTQIAV